MNREDVVAYIQDVHFGYLATVSVDDKPHVRPVAIHTIYDDCLFFFTFSHTRKVRELENNPFVEVVWSKLKEQSQVRISGKTYPETDREIQQRFKSDNPIIEKLLPPEAQHLFQLYRLEPDKVETASGLVPYEETIW